jgi:uncharacterized protein (DUF983 family)
VSKPRVTTDEQCKELADWWWSLKQMGTVRDKAKELGISVCAVYDAISRGLQQPTAGQRFKISQYQSQIAPRGTCAKCGQEHERRRADGRPQSYCAKCHAEYNRPRRPKYSDLTPEQKLKANARAYANEYQRRGLLVQKPCEVCGAEDSQKHHPDYSKPLEVVWLCRQHHMDKHPHEPIFAAPSGTNEDAA